MGRGIIQSFLTKTLFLLPEMTNVKNGTVKWRSPSNIALIKYWGKHGNQLPANPSLSFTLDKSFTEMEIAFGPRTDQKALTFFFEGKEKPQFAQRISRYLDSIRSALPFLQEVSLVINSSNSFPHSAGIASSASSMSALALCLCSIEEVLTNVQEEEVFFKKASRLARLASGSASRSVYGGAVVWGETGEPQYSNDYAVPFSGNIHPDFKDFRDTILVVNSGPKSTSSSVGHELMNNHPLSESRYKSAKDNLRELSQVLEEGNLPRFCDIVENEALTLHSLMMTSEPSVLLLEGATLEIVHRIRAFREETKLPVCFTIDAGPNIHLLYPAGITDEIGQFINDQVIVYCEHQKRIDDQVGQGPARLT